MGESVIFKQCFFVAIIFCYRVSTFLPPAPSIFHVFLLLFVLNGLEGRGGMERQREIHECQQKKNIASVEILSAGHDPDAKPGFRAGSCIVPSRRK